MNLNPSMEKQRISFQHSVPYDVWKRNVAGLRQSEKEAYQFILEFISLEEMSEMEKMSFLRAVETLSSAVRAQGDGSMNTYFPKDQLADRIETLILQESTENLVSSVRQQAMLCIVALSQVNPPFDLSHKLHLVNAGIFSVFSLPLIMPSLKRKDNVSLYMQTVQALDDMLQALVMNEMNPNMLMLQTFLEILLPWATQSEKSHEQSRSLGTIARLLRFICNFPELSGVHEFSVFGKLMGIFGLFYMNCDDEISDWASEALHYLFRILVLQRSLKYKMERLLKDLQKHFRGGYIVTMQYLTMFFKKYLTPGERADVILVSLEAMTDASQHDSSSVSKMLTLLLKDAIPEIGKVPEIVQYIHDNISNTSESTAQATMQRTLFLLAETYTDQVILTLIKMKDKSHKGFHRPWEILASSAQSYSVIMEHLLKRLTSDQGVGDQEHSQTTLVSPLIATRAIYELLLEPSRRMEVQTFFPSLFLALLLQVSLLIVEREVEIVQDLQYLAERMDPVSCTMDALKTLLLSSGYGNYVSDIQRLGGWGLLTNPERHYDGVILLARTMVAENCWHNRPIFNFIINKLQELQYENNLTVCVFVTELLRSREVAAIVDDITAHVLVNWFCCEKLTMVKLLLQMAETFAKHGNMVRQLHILQPYLFSCCYSMDSDIVMETFRMLKRLLGLLTWRQEASFIIQLAFLLESFFEEESESLRLTAFESYEVLLAKVNRQSLVLPLKHQVLSLIVALVLHIKDENVSIGQVCRTILCHVATILGWSKLKEAFAKKDVWTILRVLVEQKRSRHLWFLRQCTTLFKSPQPFIRQVAVWFAGQVIPAVTAEDATELEETYTALRCMQTDPDTLVSGLATQTCYILDARKKMQRDSTSTCSCWQRFWRRYS